MTRIDDPVGPDGQVRRWINRSLLFLETDFDRLARGVAHVDFSGAEITAVRQILRRFLGGYYMTMHETGAAADMVGAMITSLEEIYNPADQRSYETLNYLFDCIMNECVGPADVSALSTPHFAVSAV